MILPTITRPSDVRAAGESAAISAFSVGFARADITPSLGLGRVGYGPFGTPGLGCVGRLYATALVLDDGKGERVAILAADLHGGSRWLTETLGARLASTCKLPADRIFFTALHVHSSFGPFYGHMSYDRLTSTCFPDDWDTPFDLETARALAARLGDALEAAVDDLRPGKVGYAFAPAHRSGWARSSFAMGWNPESGNRDPDVEKPISCLPPMSEKARLRWAARLNPGVTLPGAGGAQPTAKAPFSPTAGDEASDEASTGKTPKGGHEAAAAAVTQVYWRSHHYDTADDAMKSVNRMSWPPECPIGALIIIAGAVRAAKKAVGGSNVAPIGPKNRESIWDRALLDVRIHTLFAENDQGDTLSIHFFGATSTVMGDQLNLFSADAYGSAALRMERTLGSPGRRHYASFAAGTVGDANVVSPKRGAFDLLGASARVDTALRVVEEAAEPLAQAALQARELARAQASDQIRLRAAFQEARPAGSDLGGTHRLSPAADLAVPTVAASELAGMSGIKRTLLKLFAGVFEGNRAPYDPYRADDPQHPKLAFPKLASPPEVLSFRLIELQRADGAPIVALAGAPFEVGSIVGLRIRERVRDAIQRRDAHSLDVPVIVASLVGDHVGYACTKWEYLAQHYEGASTLWGRWTGEWCTAKLVELVDAIPGYASGAASFSSGTRPNARRFTVDDLPKAARKLPLPAWKKLACRGKQAAAMRLASPLGAAGSAIAAMIIARASPLTPARANPPPGHFLSW